MNVASKTRTVPVIEVFGPVVQGEGSLAGLPCHFIRFGGCDYRCEWCDSMYAVEPSEVREHAEKLSADQLADRVDGLGRGPRWVILSGGNPAILELADVVALLQSARWRVSVETQGSRWRDWLADVDCLTVSPKPPSSGMADHTAKDLPGFMEKAVVRRRHRPLDCLKIVVFDEDDYLWARDVFERYPEWAGFLSVGTDPVGRWGSQVVKAVSHQYTVSTVGERYAWLCARAAGDEAMRNVRLFPQLHVVAFGHARGV